MSCPLGAGESSLANGAGPEANSAPPRVEVNICGALPPLLLSPHDTV